jgi:hypothetical protein
MEEQREILRVMKEQDQLEKDLVKDNAIDMYYEYEEAVLELMDISADLDLAIQYHLDNNKEVIQVEEQRILDAMHRDSMLVGLHTEWKYTDRVLKATRESLTDSKNINPNTLVELAGLEMNLLEVQDRMIDIRLDLGDEDIDALKTKSNLDTWSDFAYQRYTYGGLKFEILSGQRKQMNQVDEYIQQINQLIADKMYEVVDTSSFPPDLMPTSPEGVTAYYAPPVPLWNPQTSAFYRYGEVDETDMEELGDSSTVETDTRQDILTPDESEDTESGLQPESNLEPALKPDADAGSSGDGNEDEKDAPSQDIKPDEQSESSDNSSDVETEDDSNQLVEPSNDDKQDVPPDTTGEAQIGDDDNQLIEPTDDGEQDVPPDTTGQQADPDAPEPSGSDDN